MHFDHKKHKISGKYLFQNGISFEFITGRLSVQDAEMDNWLSSIPYYAKFQQYVPEEAGYQLTFCLFEDKEAMLQKQCVKLPDYKEKEVFRIFVEDFQKAHIRQCKDAWFYYTVDRCKR